VQGELERVGLGLRRPHLIHWPGAMRAGTSTLGRHDEGGRKTAAPSPSRANFTPEDLSNVIDLTFFAPAINQIELHPLLNQAALRAAMRARRRDRGVRAARRR